MNAQRAPRLAPTGRNMAASRPYNFSVEPQGLIKMTGSTLRFRARLTSSRGGAKFHDAIVENTPEEPNLVNQISEILAKGGARMLVTFANRKVTDRDNRTYLRSFAVIVGLPFTAQDAMRRAGQLALAI